MKIKGLFLISYLHQTTTCTPKWWCQGRLFLISYLHQTTTSGWWCLWRSCCFLSRIYIKPQLNREKERSAAVVSYLVSTSNHNVQIVTHFVDSLFLISYLHQTTTYLNLLWSYEMLFLISYLHQTTTQTVYLSLTHRCFLSRIYIKPQPSDRYAFRRFVVSYLVSTSNHNFRLRFFRQAWVVSYLVSTSNHNFVSDINIGEVVVSYLVSTSNHNLLEGYQTAVTLFLISYLHQTTTSMIIWYLSISCFLSRIYIKPQLSKNPCIGFAGCFLSRIYIKPQRSPL